MQTELFNPNAQKVSLNLSINQELLQQTQELNINLSLELERWLSKWLLHRHHQQWLQENQVALEDYNRHINHHGVFSDGQRRF